MKTTQTAVPAIASLVIIFAMFAFLLAPGKAGQVYQLPISDNGWGCTLIRGDAKRFHLSIFRDGRIAVDGNSLRLDDLSAYIQEICQDPRWIDSRRFLRIYLHPDAPMASLRAVYEQAQEVEIQGIHFAVWLPTDRA